LIEEEEARIHADSDDQQLASVLQQLINLQVFMIIILVLLLLTVVYDPRLQLEELVTERIDFFQKLVFGD
jgi:hypothetical protein